MNGKERKDVRSQGLEAFSVMNIYRGSVLSETCGTQHGEEIVILGVLCLKAQRGKMADRHQRLRKVCGPNLDRGHNYMNDLYGVEMTEFGVYLDTEG